MRPKTRLGLGLLSLMLVIFPAQAQIPPSPVQNLVAQYEALSTPERVAFLQAIALLGFQAPVLTPNKAETLNTNFEGTKSGTTVPATIDLAEPTADNEAIAAIKPTEPSSSPENSAGLRTHIRLVTTQKTAYTFGGSENPNHTVFSLLLPEYNQKISDPNRKITADELRDEAINFYMSGLEQELTGCGYQVISGLETPSENSLYLLETGINRIVINKTLLETSLIGEATARFTPDGPTAQDIEPVGIIKARTVQEISSVDQEGPKNALKSALGTVISQLSKQVSDKLCLIRP